MFFLTQRTQIFAFTIFEDIFQFAKIHLNMNLQSAQIYLIDFEKSLDFCPLTSDFSTRFRLTILPKLFWLS